MKKHLWIWLLILTALICFITTLTSHIQQTAKISQLLIKEDTIELLRQQEVPAELYEAFCGYEKESEHSRYDYLLGYLVTEADSQRELENYLSNRTEAYITTMNHIEKALTGRDVVAEFAAENGLQCVDGEV